MDVFYVIHNIVLLGPSFSTECAFKEEAPFFRIFFDNVLEQYTAVIACKSKNHLFDLKKLFNNFLNKTV